MGDALPGQVWECGSQAGSMVRFTVEAVDPDADVLAYKCLGRSYRVSLSEVVLLERAGVLAFRRVE